MPANSSVKYLFIINSVSGRNDGSFWEKTIIDFFQHSPAGFRIYILPKKFALQEIEDEIRLASAQNVIAVGGDGTVTMLAGILAGKNIPLGILPGGSANGMAKELGIPDDAAGALKIIEHGSVKSIDLIKINDGRYCLHMSDLGLNARLIKYFDEGKLRGMFGYAKVILKTLWHREKMYVSICTKDTEVKRIAYMVVLANARMYGTGAVINPEGKPGDGLFEVIIVRKLAVTSLIKMLARPGMFNPKHIEILPCTSVQIKTTRKIHFQVDGEYLGKIKKVSAEINAGAVKMILPEG